MKRLSEIPTVPNRSANEPETICGWSINLLFFLQKLPRDPIDCMKNTDSGKHITQTDKDVKHQDECLSSEPSGKNVGGGYLRTLARVTFISQHHRIRVGRDLEGDSV